MTSRTEAPTERRLKAARRAGHVPFSLILCRGAALGAALLTLPIALGRLVSGATAWWRAVLAPGALLPEGLAERSAEFLLDAALPVLYATFATIWLVGLAQTGGALRGGNAGDEGTMPRSSVSFGRRTLPFVGEVLVLLGAAALCAHHLPSVANGFGQPERGLALLGALGLQFVQLAAGTLVAVGLVDWLWARRDWYESLRMTPQEKREEFRREAGSPEVRRARDRARAEGTRPA